MEEEIEYRKVTLRKNLLEDVKEARSHGDLSENFEYYAAKKEKNRNESRIRYLEKVLKFATVIEDDSKEDEIGLENTVTVRFEEDGSTDARSVHIGGACNIKNGCSHPFFSVRLIISS